jgi:hypothetical protein
MINPIIATTDALKRQLLDHSIIWVGAGASIPAGYPSATKLVHLLKEASDDEIDGDDYLSVADQFVRSRGPVALRTLLQREIGVPRPLTDFHRSLAKLAKGKRIHTIITTNYDDLIERALAEQTVSYVLQIFEMNFEAAGPDTVRIIKVHGSYQDWSQVILSGDSYKKFQDAYDILNKYLDILCMQYPLTFVGSSLCEPRVLGWLAGLSEARRHNMLPWRAFLTSEEWERLLAYRFDKFEAKDVLVGPFRPLILKDHFELPKIWSSVAEEFLTKNLSTEEVPAPQPVSYSDFIQCCVLLREALDEAYIVSIGGGSTTHFYRRLELAERWCSQVQEHIARGLDRRLVDHADYFQNLIKTIRVLIAETRRNLPEPVEADEKPRFENKFFLEAQEQAKHAEYFFKNWLKEGDILINFNEVAKWEVLGFRDEKDFQSYIYPTIHQIVQWNDPMVDDLVRRLVREPRFTPLGLSEEGYTKALVMDMVNALIKEKWAIWTDLSVIGSRAKAEVTPVGQRLLTKLIDEVSHSRI